MSPDSFYFNDASDMQVDSQLLASVIQLIAALPHIDITQVAIINYA